MKITVVGSTGQTGYHVVRLALKAGHEVQALLRNPAKMPLKHQRLTVIKGNVLSETFLATNFADQDVVISCLNTHPGLCVKITLYTDSIEVITGAMRQAGVKRLITMTSWCTGSDPKDPGPFLMEYILKPLFMKIILENMTCMEEYLMKECHDIIYTIVRPPRVVKDRTSGKELISQERFHVKEACSTIPNVDVAKFMVSCAETSTWESKAVAIGVPWKII
ncbi:flavin reductase (NADPH)-like [Antedon mediterranea]|uniref:flavin reductase (NADPH)-like n=1 Tax=Antedon mediterranea TaxID=105859 RepID=UPI003AF94D9C